jgi:hypothetical protein
MRGEDGLRQEIVRFARTRREAESAIEAAVETALVSPDVRITRSMNFLEAGQTWLQQIARPDSRLSTRTIADYTWTWTTYLESPTSTLRGLTLYQANDPQRLRGFLQRVAQAHGSASAKKAKSVISGVIAYAVDSGVLTSNAMRQVRTVTSTKSPTFDRDHTRAMTRAERDRVVRQGYDAAQVPGLNPRTRRKRVATADLVSCMAGTGVCGSTRHAAFAGIRSTSTQDACTSVEPRAAVRTVGSIFQIGWLRGFRLVLRGTEREATCSHLRRT